LPIAADVVLQGSRYRSRLWSISTVAASETTPKSARSSRSRSR
jgi:hypothetical protein